MYLMYSTIVVFIFHCCNSSHNTDKAQELRVANAVFILKPLQINSSICNSIVSDPTYTHVYKWLFFGFWIRARCFHSGGIRVKKTSLQQNFMIHSLVHSLKSFSANGRILSVDRFQPKLNSSQAV